MPFDSISASVKLNLGSAARWALTPPMRVIPASIRKEAPDLNQRLTMDSETATLCCSYCQEAFLAERMVIRIQIAQMNLSRFPKGHLRRDS
jgi:hypothetical protein